MVSWFAGLFYLPRIFVNLAMTTNDETYQHLFTMARKLYRFVTPFMLLTVILGSWMLYLNPGLLNTGWMLSKLILVATLIVYHFRCGYYLSLFENKTSARGHVFYRWFNEYPVIVLFTVIIFAVIKPF
jgi:putative membrane protein